MYDIITFGSAAMDIIVRPKKLTSLAYNKESENSKKICLDIGSKVDVDSIEFASGGGGTNTAATFALQGLKTAFVGSVGDDTFGKDIIAELKKLKVDTKFVVVTKEKPTNSSIVILNQENDRTILAYRGASECLVKETIPYKKLQAKWIYLAPMTGNLCYNFEEIVDFAHKNNIRVAVNPSMAQLSLQNFPNIAKKVDLLILNEEEASFLTKLPMEQESEIFKKIDEMCSGVAMMTKGEKGILVSDGKKLYSAKPHGDRKVVDTTGAGDSFASGFLVDFIRTNGDIEKAIQMGMANSEANIAEFGAKNGLLKKGQTFNPVSVQKQSI